MNMTATVGFRLSSSRAILHSDLNCFFASVETVLDPSLRGKPVAVCGDPEERHGIVLAKTETAKKAGVKTGMVVWQAKQLCPALKVISDPHYEYYLKFSKLVRKIYERYTNRVEPFGIDECWLDITELGSQNAFEVANEIRNTVREELGLTVSIGVSFNKTLAKLGSDLKKPDAVTVLSPDNFHLKIDSLPVGSLMFCGPATARKLHERGINTIGDLSSVTPEYMKKWFGVNGIALWKNANGFDDSPVMPSDYEFPVKSVGHGTTFTEDLTDNDDIHRYFLELSQDIGRRLRIDGLASSAVTVFVRDSGLVWRPLGIRHGFPTQSPKVIAERAYSLFVDKYRATAAIRNITVRAVELCPASSGFQPDIFTNAVELERQEKLDDAVYCIRDRFGKRSIIPASLMKGLKMAISDTRDELRNFGAPTGF